MRRSCTGGKICFSQFDSSPNRWLHLYLPHRLPTGTPFFPIFGSQYVVGSPFCVGAERILDIWHSVIWLVVGKKIWPEPCFTDHPVLNCILVLRHLIRANLLEGGITPVETNRTQGLENSGLIGLQRQIMRGMSLTKAYVSYSLWNHSSVCSFELSQILSHGDYSSLGCTFVVDLEFSCFWAVSMREVVKLWDFRQKLLWNFGACFHIVFPCSRVL
jgi:hypothetical protein